MRGGFQNTSIASNRLTSICLCKPTVSNKHTPHLVPDLSNVRNFMPSKYQSHKLSNSGTPNLSKFETFALSNCRPQRRATSQIWSKPFQLENIEFSKAKPRLDTSELSHSTVSNRSNTKLQKLSRSTAYPAEVEFEAATVVQLDSFKG